MFEDSNKPAQYKPRQILPDSLLSHQGIIDVSSVMRHSTFPLVLIDVFLDNRGV